MGAVDIRIGHHHDLVVAQLADVELLADAGADSGDQRADLLVRQDLVDAVLLGVDDLPAKRQDGLRVAIAALLGRAAGGVTLHDEELGQRGVAHSAIRQLARKVGALERGLAGEVACLAGRLARARRRDRLADHLVRLAGVLLEELTELAVDGRLDEALHLGVPELRLRLAFELRLVELHRDDRRQAFAHVLAGQRDLLALQHARFLGVIVDRAGQRRAKRRHVRPAVALRDVVGERQDVLVITVVPFERDVDADAVAHRRDGDRLREQGSFRAVEIFDEGGDPALVIKLVLDALLVPSIGEDQADARIQEGELAEAMLEPLEVEFDDLEGLRARQERDLGALLAVRRRADDFQRRFGVAMAEAHEMLFALAPDGKIEPLAERVDDADADAVEPAGDFVRIVLAGVFELTAGMELGHDDLGRGHAFLGVDPGWNATTVVLNGDRPVGVQLNEDAVAVAGERFVDGIVRNLEHHVVEARAIVGVADVHARPLAHRVETLEDLDRVRAIFILIGVGCHSPDIGIYGRKSRAHACTRTCAHA